MVDFDVHPPFWSFCLDACEELQRVHGDIPSILYGTLCPPEYPFYNTLKEQREVAKANFEAGLIDLDGYLGKVGALSLTTGRSKAVADDDDAEDAEDAVAVPKRKANEANAENPPKKKQKVGAAVPGRRGRPAKNTGKDARNVSNIAINAASVVEIEDTPAEVPPQEASRPATLPWPTLEGLLPLPSALPATSSRTTSSAVPRVIVAGQHQAPIVLSSIHVFNNSLHAHIQKFNLGLRERALIPGDGNCWFAIDSNTLVLTPPQPFSPEKSSVILTPPPPCSPATPPRRGRGRPRKRVLDDTSPAKDAPAKRGRGRPRKN